jgi:hypothetical protein
MRDARGVWTGDGRAFFSRYRSWRRLAVNHDIDVIITKID